MMPDRIYVEKPRPKAHIWIGADGQIVTVLVTDCDDHISLEENPRALIFTPEWEVTVTDLGARP